MELSTATFLLPLLVSNSLCVCFFYHYYRALHIAVVQGEFAMVCKLIQLLIWARRGLDIYNNLRQVKKKKKII